MRSLRRYHVPGGTYFITVVTHERQPVLLKRTDLFWKAWGNVELLAWVIMPDHFHAILRPDQQTISEVVHRFKLRYVRNLPLTIRPTRFWQNRFWDHVIKNDSDFNRHLDYVHYNPVHHGHASDASAWQHSSLEHWTSTGFYESGCGKIEAELEDHDFGEPK